MAAPEAVADTVMMEGVAPRTVENHGGNLTPWYSTDPIGQILVLLALMAALAHGLVTVWPKRPRLTNSTRLAPGALLAFALAWVTIPGLATHVEPHIEGYYLERSATLIALLGFVLTQWVAEAVLTARRAPPTRVGVIVIWLSLAAWLLGLFGLFASGVFIPIEPTPSPWLRLGPVLLGPIMAAGLLLAWRRLGGRAFSLVFNFAVLCLIGLAMFAKGISVPTAGLFVALIAISGMDIMARVLRALGARNAERLTGWSPWFWGWVCRIIVVSIGLSEPSF